MKSYPHYNGWRDRNGHVPLEDLKYARKREPSIYRQIWNDIKWAYHQDRRQFVKICVYAAASIGLLIMFLGR